MSRWMSGSLGGPGYILVNCRLCFSHSFLTLKFYFLVRHSLSRKVCNAFSNHRNTFKFELFLNLKLKQTRNGSASHDLFYLKR